MIDERLVLSFNRDMSQQAKQDLIDAVSDINQSYIDNHDWFPGDTTKLLNLIHTYELALAIRAEVMSHGGSSAEELRFNFAVSEDILNRRMRQHEALTTASSSRGGFRQHQLTRSGDRYA